MSRFFDYQTTHDKFFTKHGRSYAYKKGQYIVSQNDESNKVFFLKEGLIEVIFSLPDGNNRVIGYFLPGMSFAQSGSFFKHYDAEIEYIATKKSTVLCVTQEHFLSELNKNNEFNQEYRNWLHKVQLLLIERIVYQGQNGIKQKMVGWLLFMCRYYGNNITDNQVEIDIPLTHEVIANFLHITRESAGASIRSLARNNILSMQHKKNHNSQYPSTTATLA